MRTVKAVICLLSCVLLKEDRGTHRRKERSPPEDQNCDKDDRDFFQHKIDLSKI